MVQMCQGETRKGGKNSKSCVEEARTAFSVSQYYGPAATVTLDHGGGGVLVSRSESMLASLLPRETTTSMPRTS